jgi:hypothetical protein
LDLAGQIRQHRFPLLGLTLDTGAQIRWRRDYERKVETDTDYFRLIPYLDPARAGDHKIVWELNRHQHLVALAQATLFADPEPFVAEIAAQLESWFEQNPFHRGINWASALEVAFRALSWAWVDRLAGAQLPAAVLDRLREGLYQHACHLERNLSFYFSPNTHLLGEAVALHALGVFYPSLPGAARWRKRGAEVVRAEIARQVQADGSHFENSSYYHVYALDMFLFHALLERPDAQYLAAIDRMASYLDALAGPSRELPFLGDDDGGRFFHPYGTRSRFARATLAACAQFLKKSGEYEEADLHPMAAWWLPEMAPVQAAKYHPRSRHFDNCGVVVMAAGDRHVICDAGGFGWNRGGHSHSDTLSVVVRIASEEILIDPGTYTYVDASMREAFRGSSAHNTLEIDGKPQAVPQGPFAWSDPPAVRIREWTSTPERDVLDAEYRHAGLCHRRRLVFQKPVFEKPSLLEIEDEVTGPRDAQHHITQFWHLGSRAAEERIEAEGLERIEGWRSDAYGHKEPAIVLARRWRGELPCRFHTRIRL